MKIFLAASSSFWNKLPEIKEKLESLGKWCDAFYLLNYDKHDTPGYVGGAALIELYIAHREYKKIFIENDVFPGPMYDDIMGFGPVFVHGDLSKIR